jgi:hypothetical protein
MYHHVLRYDTTPHAEFDIKKRKKLESDSGAVFHL